MTLPETYGQAGGLLVTAGHRLERVAKALTSGDLRDAGAALAEGIATMDRAMFLLEQREPDEDLTPVE